MSRPALFFALPILLGCSGAEPLEQAGFRAGDGLPSIQLLGQPLDARAFVAEAAFFHAKESREIVRSLKRRAFTSLEAERLGLAVDQDRLESEFESMLQATRAALGDTSFEQFVEESWGRPWKEVEIAWRERTASNQLYQLVLRADALLTGQVRLFHFRFETQPDAEALRDRLLFGADPAFLAKASSFFGPNSDGSFAPVALYLPEPLGSWVAAAEAGDVSEAFQFEGDLSWQVVYIAEKIAPIDVLPPREVLFEGLEANPIDGMQGRAWFEEMSRRYNAGGTLPRFSALNYPFVLD